jgi:hypothetical protein
MNDYVFAGIVLSILIIIVLIWYYNPYAWSKLSFKQGDLVAVPIPSGKNWYSLRFKKCIFNVTNNANGEVLINGDVSGVLNDVARGYTKADCENYSISASYFTLPIALNPFLFQFPANTASGVRDSSNNPLSPWCNSIQTCSTSSDCSGLGNCVLTTSPNNSGCEKIQADSSVDLPGSPVCYTDPTTNVSSWVDANSSTLPRQCQLCKNNLTVTLNIQYRYI